MLKAAGGLLKPCYLFAPSTLLRRMFLGFDRSDTASAMVELPWGMQMQVDLADAIGSEIFRQRIFDLAVSECAWRLLQPGDRVVDAGANIGYMTLLFAARVGPAGCVHAFEPHPEVAGALEENVRRNQSANAEMNVHRTALGATSGTASLFESDYFSINRGTASLAHVPAQSARMHSVSVQRLDDALPNESFALLKIDVEGFEEELLAGAENSLASGRIRHVIYEDHSLGEGGVANKLRKYGYEIFAIGHRTFGPALLPASAAGKAIDSSWESASFLATRDPQSASASMRAKGWRVLRGR